MTATLMLTRAEPFVMRYHPMPEPMTDDELFEFCQMNGDWRIERSAEGELLFMPPAGGETGHRNAQLNRFLWSWAETDGTGVVFDSSTGFTLPNGAMRSPDAAWLRRACWEALAPEERRKFPPLCPDFVAELRSPTDALETLQAKLEEYLANGARLGWLIDPEERNVHIYRPGSEVVCLADPKSVSGDPVLPGFVLDLAKVWYGTS
jgi:Uma2 family endonuclease